MDTNDDVCELNLMQLASNFSISTLHYEAFAIRCGLSSPMQQSTCLAVIIKRGCTTSTQEA